MLLNPIARMLAGRKLAIIAGGGIQQIPFAVLPDPMTGLPLIQEHEITMLPSASTLVLERRRAVGRKRPPRSMVLFADPVYSGDDPRLGTNAVPGITGVTFPRLAYSRLAADAILPIAPPDALLLSGFAANLSVVKEGRLGEFQFLHFATHGTLDSAHPEMSSIVLSLVNEKGDARDGFVRTADVPQPADFSRARVP